MPIECPKCHFENPDDTIYCGKCATPLKPSEDVSASHTETLEAPKEKLTTGSTFAERYQIIEELGKGGMGKVYRVIDKEINEEVALKLIKPEIASDIKTLDRFKNELKLARKVSHKNVGRMYELMEKKGTHFITMEYVSGEDLKSFIRRAAPLSIGKSISVAKQVCEGLSEAHRLGVVHRDLKPSNIMIDEEGNARIMDFGIARSLKAKKMTGKGMMIGTPEYMSPEQVEGKKTDQRSDIYSMGVILYEMSTGKVPFEGDTSISIALKHKTEEPRDPREFNEQIPEELSAVILKCMEKAPESRFEDIEELLSELQNIEKGIPTTERVTLKRKPAIPWKNLLLYGGVAIIAVLLILGGLLLIIGQRGGIDSIAVLPLRNLSGDPDQEYFAEGMTEALIADLAKISSLRVTSRTSVMRFKEFKKPLPEIAQELKVDAIVEGSVLRIGDRVRITAQLIEAKTDRNLWSKSYERDLRDIMSLQREVAQAIAKEINIKLTPQEETLLASARPVDPEAHEAYLRGRHHTNDWSGVGFSKAIEYFQSAIEKDPDYAHAYAGLADAYVGLGIWGVTSSKETMPKAKAAALKALELDDTLAEAHSALGGVMFLYEWDWTAAEKEYKRAIELNPNNAIALQRYADYLTTMGFRKEGMSEIKRAKELEPLSPPVNFALALHHYYSRQYDEMIGHCYKVLEMEPNLFLHHMHLWRAYRQKEMYEESLAEAKKFLSKLGASVIVVAMEKGYEEAGYKGAMSAVAKIFATYSNVSFVSPLLIAYLYAHAEEQDQAFKWLERAYNAREPLLVFLRIEPDWDNMRSDPRFQDLLQRIGLPENDIP